jgi:hypothetical protein
VGWHGSGKTRISYPLLANAPTCRATHEPNLRRLSRTANMCAKTPAGCCVSQRGGSNANGLCWRFLAEPTGVIAISKYMASALNKRLDNFNPTPQVPPLSTQPPHEPPLAPAPREEQSTPRIEQIAKLTTVVVPHLDFGPGYQYSHSLRGEANPHALCGLCSRDRIWSLEQRSIAKFLDLRLCAQCLSNNL